MLVVPGDAPFDRVRLELVVDPGPDRGETFTQIAGELAGDRVQGVLLPGNCPCGLPRRLIKLDRSGLPP